MATYEEAAAGLAQALKSGNTQDAEAALALYADAVGDDDVPEVTLGPAKRVLSSEEAAEASEVGGGTEDDQEAAAINASDSTPATTTVDAGPEHSLDEIAQPVDSDDSDEDVSDRS